MLQQSIKVSLIAVSVEELIIDLPFAHQVLFLANSVDNPSETPLSTWKTELFQQRRIRLRVQVKDI
jgi:hypothetical protein